MALLLHIFVTLHPAQLFPHIQFVPFFSKTMDFTILDLEYGTSGPLCLPSAGFDAIMRFSAMAPFR